MRYDRLHFLFPSHPLRPAVVEPMFADQQAALVSAGFTTSLISDRDARPLRNIPPGATVVYRGWMLNADEYGSLVARIGAAAAVPLTSLSAYLSAHHLPNWYPLVAECTPETRVLPQSADFAAELRSLGWPAFFIKDFVKSVKTSVGSILTDPSQIDAVVAELKRIRGDIEGGLCVRRVEPFLHDTERRYFVLDKTAFSDDDGPVPTLVSEVAGRMPSPFFSVDVVRRDDGVWRIVEIGDGQVSDLVGWTSDLFTRLWSRRR